MNIQTEAKLKEVLELLRQGNPFDAQSIISSLFESDLDSYELNYTNKCFFLQGKSTWILPSLAKLVIKYENFSYFNTITLSSYRTL